MNLRSTIIHIAAKLPKGDETRRKLLRLAADEPYDGNPSGKPIYPNAVPHGYDQPLSGGTDVMKRLQDKLLHEQGRPERDKNPRLARARSERKTGQR
jgi:hypothetical protein